jgi:hypothetical protein
MAAQVALVPGVGHGNGVPWHASTFHLQPTEAQSELFKYAPHIEAVPVHVPPDAPPSPVAPPAPPSPPVPPLGWPPVPEGVVRTAVPPAPPNEPPSGTEGVQRQAVKIPAGLHVCAPCSPDGHAHSTLAPGIHLGAPPPPPQAESTATRREATSLAARFIAAIVTYAASFRNLVPAADMVGPGYTPTRPDDTRSIAMVPL